MTDKILCIYHGGCTDGVAAAWAVWRALGERVEFYPGVYQQEPPDCSGRDVVFVDFTYKRPVIERIASVARSVLILDHHKTAEADLVPPPDGVTVEFDMGRCGALMAWDHYHNSDARPLMLIDVDARDRWVKGRSADNDALIMALRSYPHDRAAAGGMWALLFKAWDRLMDPRHRQELLVEGRAINRYYQLRVDDALALAADWRINGMTVPAANCNYSLVSDVAGTLAESTHGVGAGWYVDGDRVVFSLRGRKGVDVSELAKIFGGGGHAGAAGFAVPVAQVDFAAREVLAT